MDVDMLFCLRLMVLFGLDDLRLKVIGFEKFWDWIFLDDVMFRSFCLGLGMNLFILIDCLRILINRLER